MSYFNMNNCEKSKVHIYIIQLLINLHLTDINTRHITRHQSRRQNHPSVIPAFLPRADAATKRIWTPKFQQNVFSSKMIPGLTGLSQNIKRYNTIL